ncbi:MAG TPA: amidohydrolase family protein [Candidatus Binatia bacterium]
MGPVIDADTHVSESEHMWSLFEKEMHPKRPVLVSVPDDTVYGGRNAFWLIDGNIVPKPAGKAGNILITPAAQKSQASRTDIPLESRELTGPEVRIRDMDRLGVHTQVVFPTLFLVYLTDDVALEVALCRAYNRWMSEACARGGERLRWIAIPPLRSVEGSVKEIRWAKEHGAVGLFFRGIEKDLNLDDPYFFPVYQAAMDHDIPICIHTGAGSPILSSLFNVERHSAYGHGRVPPIIAFRNLVANKIPEMFSTLRFGFIEASAGWVPYVLHALKRQSLLRGREFSTADLFRDYRLYVACEADEDIGYLARYIGEDNMIIGSDYAHRDPSEERELVKSMRSREDVPERITDRILSDNPKSFYGL